MKALMDRHASKKISINLPSLRVDSLNPLMVEQIKRVRKTGFTLAPEAGSDRLRRIINKGLTREEILEMARFVYGAGWNLIKLYFMIGLPFEGEGDLQEIIELSRQVSELAGRGGSKPKLNVSISSFVPKSHTPFMWASQIPLEESRRRIQLIRKGLLGSQIRVKWNQPELSWLEGIFSRGDRRLSRAILVAWRLGARFDAWGDQFQVRIWEEAFRRCGIDPRQYLYRERAWDEILPWDHIRSGVNKSFLVNEWEKAQKGKSTPDCRRKCLDCGVCDHELVGPVLFPTTNFPLPSRTAHLKDPHDLIPKKYRLTFTKQDQARYLSHLELVQVFIRAFKRAGLNLLYSNGFHPMPKLSFTSALPVGTESLHETMDIELTESSDTLYLKDCIRRQLPPGIDIISVQEIYRNKKEKLKESSFSLTVNGAEIDKAHLKRFMESDFFPVVKMTKKGEHSINARPLVKSIETVSPNKIELVLKHTEGPTPKPDEIVKAIFFLKDLRDCHIETVKTKQLFA